MRTKRIDARKACLVFASSVLPSVFLLGCTGPDPVSDGGGPEFGMPGPPSLSSITPLTRPEGLDEPKVALGKALFDDTRLSADGTVSCSNCHDLSTGGDDGRRTAVGIGGHVGTLNTPTVLNSSMNVAQFWDGRARTLEEQIDDTVQSPTEMGGDWPSIVKRLRADEHTADRFCAVFGGPPTAARIKEAIAEYLRALVTVGAPFDRFLAGDSSAMRPEAVMGYRLFTRLGCVSCHQGRNVGGNFFQRIGVMGDYFAARPAAIHESDLGRFNVTGDEDDRFKFKVPSLRNVAETAPYFHDGSAATLEEAVRTMVRVQLGRPVKDDEIAKLVAFLESLSGEVDESLL